MTSMQFPCCFHLFICFVEQVCSPKELLVGLLEQVEEADTGSIAETVTLLLKPLQTGFSSLCH